MSRNPEHILYAVASVFVAAVSKNNPVMLRLTEIHNEVCRILHRRKEKEKKNLDGPVKTAVNNLKIHRVLFESVDECGPEKLKTKRSKSADAIRRFGLTTQAQDYVKKDEMLRHYRCNRDVIITRLLEAFKVIEIRRPPLIIAPDALVKTVASIKQEQEQEQEKITPVANQNNTATAEKSATTNNVQRLISTVRNKSKTWQGTCGTPADLLGGMLAMWVADKEGPNTPVSARKLNFSFYGYALCRDFLLQHGLVESFSERRNPYAKTGHNKVKSHGIKLTPLGLEVAVDGGFKDERTHDQTQTKTGPMLKNQKKQPTTAAPESTITLTTQQLADLNAQLHALNNKVSNQEREIALLRTNPPATTAETAITQPKPAVPVEYSDVVTVSVLLSAAVPNLVASIETLLDDKFGAEYPKVDQHIDCVNARGVYLALTEIEKTIFGIKCYISECLYHNSPVDVELLKQYAEQYREAVDNLHLSKVLPIMSDKLLTKAVWRKSEATTHRVWTRAETAKV